MDFLNCMNNFPWNRFGTVYETNAKNLKEKFIKIFNGDANSSDFEYIIDRLEHQETLYRITPWGLKFYIRLLSEEKTNKGELLHNIKTLHEAANYKSQVNAIMKYNPTKGNLAKYEQMKSKLFDEEFDGIMDANFLKICKSIDSVFLQISIMEYLRNKKQLLQNFAESNDKIISKNAELLINSIVNPKQYEFED